jgi:SAM-dependent methyltransferase
MPSIEENKKYWDGGYAWPRGGDEWSSDWRTVSMQWFGTILPRIHRFVPAECIVEIGCGYGRWTQYLKNYCQRLIAIDLSESCVEACRDRFRGTPHVVCHCNDGQALDIAADHSVDFVFSFDALPLADKRVMESYISQLPRILKNNGAAFLHHSNLGDYPIYARTHAMPSLEKWLSRVGVLEKDLYWRDTSVSAKLVEQLARRYDLCCIAQETIRWGTKRILADGFSTIVRKTSPYNRKHRVMENVAFMREIDNLAGLSDLYSEEESQ